MYVKCKYFECLYRTVSLLAWLRARGRYGDLLALIVKYRPNPTCSRVDSCIHFRVPFVAAFHVIACIMGPCWNLDSTLGLAAPCLA